MCSTWGSFALWKCVMVYNGWQGTGYRLRASRQLLSQVKELMDRNSQGTVNTSFPCQHLLPGLLIGRNPKAALNKRPGSATPGLEPRTTHRVNQVEYLWVRIAVCSRLYGLHSNDRVWVLSLCLGGKMQCNEISIKRIYTERLNDFKSGLHFKLAEKCIYVLICYQLFFVREKNNSKILICVLSGLLFEQVWSLMRIQQQSVSGLSDGARFCKWQPCWFRGHEMELNMMTLDKEMERVATFPLRVYWSLSYLSNAVCAENKLWTHTSVNS